MEFLSQLPLNNLRQDEKAKSFLVFHLDEEKVQCRLKTEMKDSNGMQTAWTLYGTYEPQDFIKMCNETLEKLIC